MQEIMQPVIINKTAIFETYAETYETCWKGTFTA